MPWAKVLAVSGMLLPKCFLLFSGHVPPLKPFKKHDMDPKIANSHLDLANPHTHRHSSLPLTPPLQGMMKLRVVCFSILKLSSIFEHSKLPSSLLHPQNLKAQVASGRLPVLHVGFSQRGPQRSVHLPAVGSAVQSCFARRLVGLYQWKTRAEWWLAGSVWWVCTDATCHSSLSP